jgi:hypothetical protein
MKNTLFVAIAILLMGSSFSPVLANCDHKQKTTGAKKSRAKAEGGRFNHGKGKLSVKAVEPTDGQSVDNAASDPCAEADPVEYSLDYGTDNFVIN